jgi:hypothetical protein
MVTKKYEFMNVFQLSFIQFAQTTDSGSNSGSGGSSDGPSTTSKHFAATLAFPDTNRFTLDGVLA